MLTHSNPPKYRKIQWLICTLQTFVSRICAKNEQKTKILSVQFGYFVYFSPHLHKRVLISVDIWLLISCLFRQQVVFMFIKQICRCFPLKLLNVKFGHFHNSHSMIECVCSWLLWNDTKARKTKEKEERWKWRRNVEQCCLICIYACLFCLCICVYIYIIISACYCSALLNLCS